jgi:phage anti-repressor protein
MNKIVPKTINFKELVKNSTTTFSLDLQTKLVQYLNDEFTEQEQQWYIANLFIYMNYHPTNDYPINLDNVYNMLGFANKGNAMKTIKSNFVEDEDYKKQLFHTEKLVQNGKTLGGSGLNKETVMLNIDTFKNLCMLVKTDKGKQIRKYYVKLENIYNKLIKEEIEDQQKQLEQTQKELQITKKQLETKTKLAVKRWYEQEPGHVIYGYKSYSNDEQSKFLITIGKSQNIKRRESEYMTCNPSGNMFYIRRCYNSDLAERVIHHILDKFREERNKEWFDISEELTVYVIDTICDFLDMFINCSEKLPELQIKEFLNELPIPKFDSTFQSTTEETYIPEIVYNENMKNYDLFIEEFCERNENSETLPYELTSAYRIWSKCVLTNEDRREFKAYLTNNFTIQDKYYHKTGLRHKMVMNIKLKKLQFIPDDMESLTNYEKYCMESCSVDYMYKINISEFIYNYTIWMQENGFPNFTIKSREIQEIKDYFKRKMTFDNGKIYGLQLITDKIPNYKLRDLNKIYMINENKDIVHTYNGLAEASEILKLEIKQISDIIRYTKVMEYENEKMIMVYEKGDNLIKKRNVEVKWIYKYDFDTKELLNSFSSTKEAANHFEITTHTILRYISIEKVFTTKKDGKRNILLSYLSNIDDVIPKEKTKVIKTRPCKKLYTYNVLDNSLFKEYNGPFDAAAKLKIGQCTVQRHIKNNKPLNIVHEDQHKSIIFTYNKMG